MRADYQISGYSDPQWFKLLYKGSVLNTGERRAPLSGLILHTNLHIHLKPSNVPQDARQFAWLWLQKNWKKIPECTFTVNLFFYLNGAHQAWFENSSQGAVSTTKFPTYQFQVFEAERQIKGTSVMSCRKKRTMYKNLSGPRLFKQYHLLRSMTVAKKIETEVPLVTLQMLWIREE